MNVSIIFSFFFFYSFSFIDGTDTSVEDDEEFDWTIEQIPCEELNGISILGDQCGFASSYSYSVFCMKVIFCISCLIYVWDFI